MVFACVLRGIKPMGGENGKSGNIPPIIYTVAGLIAFSGGLYQLYLNIYVVEIGTTYSEYGHNNIC